MFAVELATFVFVAESSRFEAMIGKKGISIIPCRRWRGGKRNGIKRENNDGRRSILCGVRE